MRSYIIIPVILCFGGTIDMIYRLTTGNYDSLARVAFLFLTSLAIYTFGITEDNRKQTKALRKELVSKGVIEK